MTNKEKQALMKHIKSCEYRAYDASEKEGPESDLYQLEIAWLACSTYIYRLLTGKNFDLPCD